MRTLAVLLLAELDSAMDSIETLKADIVVATGKLEVVFDVDEKSLLRLQRAGLTEPGKMHIALALADEEKFPHHAELTFVDTMVNPQTGTIQLRGLCADPTALMSPGMFVRVQVTLPEGK